MLPDLISVTVVMVSQQLKDENWGHTPSKSLLDTELLQNILLLTDLGLTGMTNTLRGVP